MIDEKTLSELVGNHWTELHEYGTGGVLDDSLLEFANDVAQCEKGIVLADLSASQPSNVLWHVKEIPNSPFYGIVSSRSNWYIATDMEKRHAEIIVNLFNSTRGNTNTSQGV